MSGAGGSWALVMHGGAKDIAAEQQMAHRTGCLGALRVGQCILEQGGRALDAVEAVLRHMEDDPTFNAGFGSTLNADGRVEMDAAIMDGRTLDIGAVAAITGVRHPVTVARLMIRETPTLLVGDGARRFAAERKAELCDPQDMIAHKEAALAARRDTIGCIAQDMLGDIAVGTSTGGLDGSWPGRVGDSPLPGCGFYADNAVGAAAFSGDGESIARAMMAARVMLDMDKSGPQTAIERAIGQFRTVGGDGGGIALDHRGRIGWGHNSTGFAVGYAGSNVGGPHVCLAKDEEKKVPHDA